MTRLLFGNGARGAAVEAIQSALGILADGIYGKKTAVGVAGFQQSVGLAASGLTDEATWLALVKRPVPSLFERCLAVTAAFEGHGFTKPAGNFDGAGLTWGIVGFTLRSGSLAKVLRRTAALDSTVIPAAFGVRGEELRLALGKPWPQQLAWAGGITAGSSLQEPWRAAFEHLGRTAAARQAQLEVAREMYFEPAVAAANEIGFTNELSIALCFDIQVQNGGIKEKIAGRVRRTRGPEIRRRRVLAEWTAESALPQWRQDVLDRKLTLTLGQGTVHRRAYQLANWGLGEYLAVLEQ